MSLDKPIDGYSKNGYIRSDGTVKNEFFVKQKPSEDENGNKYITLKGERRLVKDLVEEHFGKAEKTKAEKGKSKWPDSVTDQKITGKKKKKKEKPVPTKPDTKSEKPKDDLEEPLDKENEKVVQEEKESSEPGGQAQEDPEEKVTTDEETEMIAELFKENSEFTYAEIIQKMLDKGHKVTRSQISEGKRKSGVLESE